MSILCTLYFVHCTLYIVLCTLYFVHFTLYILLCTLDLAADQHVLKHSSRSCKTKYIRVQYAALWVRPWPIAMFACITSVLSKEAFYTADMIIILYAKMLLFCGSGGGQKVSTMCSTSHLPAQPIFVCMPLIVHIWCTAYRVCFSSDIKNRVLYTGLRISIYSNPNLVYKKELMGFWHSDWCTASAHRHRHSEAAHLCWDYGENLLLARWTLDIVRPCSYVGLNGVRDSSTSITDHVWNCMAINRWSSDDLYVWSTLHILALSSLAGWNPVGFEVLYWSSFSLPLCSDFHPSPRFKLLGVIMGSWTWGDNKISLWELLLTFMQ